MENLQQEKSDMESMQTSAAYYLDTEGRRSVVAPSTELSFLSGNAFHTALLEVKNTPENLKMLTMEAQYTQWRIDNERARIQEEEMAMHRARINTNGINKLINRKVISALESEGEDTVKRELKWISDYMRANKEFGLRKKIVSFFSRKSDEAKFAKLKQKYFPGVAYEKLVILEDESIPIENRATAIYAQKAVADQEEKSMFFIQNAYRTLDKLHERLADVDDMISMFKEEDETDKLIEFYTSMQGLNQNSLRLDMPPTDQIGEIIPNVHRDVNSILYVQ